MSKLHNKPGFTIIETSLATMFLGIIVLAVANLVIQMTQIYQKGLSLRAVNDTGQQIIEDMQRQINSASATDINLDTSKDGLLTDSEIKNGTGQYFKSWRLSNSDKTQAAGAFCASSYSYVWNTAVPYSQDRNGTSRGVIIRTSGGNRRFKLGRIFDPGHEICKNSNWSTSYNSKKSFTISMTGLSNDDAIELINSDEADLVLYDLSIHPIVQSTVTKQSFVSASFILGTQRGGINIMSSSDYCEGEATGTDYDSNDFEYCAVNKFNFSIRTGGNADKKG